MQGHAFEHDRCERERVPGAWKEGGQEAQHVEIASQGKRRQIP